MNMQGNLGRNIPQPQGMPPGMPQGIASLQGMQRPQQQPQQQGPQGLQNIPQDLMRALGVRAALEAEEKAKQQIAAMTEQALNYQIPQTSIAEQDFEKLKSGELAKLTGQTNDQEFDKQNKAMQRLAQAAQGGSPLMSGIAQAPGAGQVMPARMASGGIVAFQDRGEVPEPRPEKMEGETREAFRARLYAWWNRKMQAEEAARAAIPPSPRTAARFPSLFQPRPAAPGMSEADLQDLMPTRQPLPQTQLPPEMGMEEPPQAPPSVTGPGLRGPEVKPPTAPGIVGALQQPPLPKPPEGGIAVQPKPTPSLKEFMQGMGDPEAARKARADEAANVYGLSPEEKAFYEERIQRMRGEMQPKETRWYERLGDLAAQMGPASSTIAGTLGGVARTGRTMQLDEQARRQKQQEQLDALREKMLGGARTGREKGFEAGIGAEKTAMEQQGRLGQIGASLQQTAAQREATASTATEGAANRASRERMSLAEIESREKISQKQIEAQAANTGQIQLANRLAVANARVNDAIEGANKAIKAKFGAIATLMMMDPEKAKTQNPQQYSAYMQYERELKRQLIEPAIAERDRISAQITGGTPAVRPTQPQLPEGVKVTPRQGS